MYINGGKVSNGGGIDGTQKSVTSFSGYLKKGEVLTFDRTVTSLYLGIYGLTV